VERRADGEGVEVLAVVVMFYALLDASRLPNTPRGYQSRSLNGGYLSVARMNA
jgi:hypothetical protein